MRSYRVSYLDKAQVKSQVQSRLNEFRSVLPLAVGHMTVDFYETLLPPLLPFLALSLGLSYGATGGLVSVYAFTAFLFQPLLGLVLDRHGSSFLLALSLFWGASALALVGLMESYAALLVLAGLGGVGNAVFHPLAALVVRERTTSGLGMAFWATSGSVGVALAPLAVTLVVGQFGLGATPFLVLPGLVVGMYLTGIRRSHASPPDESDLVRVSSGKHDSAEVAKNGAKPLVKRASIALLTTSACLRCAAFSAILSYLPLYFVEMGKPIDYGGYLLTLLLGTTALAVLFGGYISDRFGHRTAAVIPLILAAPTLALAFVSTGWTSGALFSLGGAALMMPHSSNIVQSQQLLPNRSATAAGLIMGLAFGIGAGSTVIVGMGADAFGLERALFATLCSLPLLSGIVAFGVRR